ncbi:hypothetical protein ACI5KX_14105 [Erythrobacter sp. GH1-10]|uniref:hypothetical protein n=1 Tax=Erythrobacter sp. GH1-10 TaxID=3349334 RepID=UPI003877D8EC
MTTRTYQGMRLRSPSSLITGVSASITVRKGELSEEPEAASVAWVGLSTANEVAGTPTWWLQFGHVYRKMEVADLQRKFDRSRPGSDTYLQAQPDDRAKPRTGHYLYVEGAKEGTTLKRTLLPGKAYKYRIEQGRDGWDYFLNEKKLCTIQPPDLFKNKELVVMFMCEELGGSSIPGSMSEKTIFTECEYEYSAEWIDADFDSEEFIPQILNRNQKSHWTSAGNSLSVWSD